MQFFLMLWEKNNQLYLYFFKSYWIKNTISYPVLYVLNDKLSFNSILETRDALDLFDHLEEVIIVAIRSGLDKQSWLKNRLHDYTPTINNTRKRA